MLYIIYTYHIPNPNAGQGLVRVHIPQRHDEVVHAHVGPVGEEEAGEDDLCFYLLCIDWCWDGGGRYTLHINKTNTRTDRAIHQQGDADTNQKNRAVYPPRAWPSAPHTSHTQHKHTHTHTHSQHKHTHTNRRIVCIYSFIHSFIYFYSYRVRGRLPRRADPPLGGRVGGRVDDKLLPS